MITRQSTIHRKYHGNTGYLLGNIDAGTQEFMGTGYHVDDGQTTWTDELQMMTSHQGRTSQLHKRITQTNHTKQDVTMEMMNNAFGCSRATQVCMEYLRLLI